MFSVGVLLYGDYPDLAGRCLYSLLTAGNAGLDSGHVGDVRIGLNACSPATMKVVDRFRACARFRVITYQPLGGANVYKYPLFRRMLYDPARPPHNHWMWFDDDSYVKRLDSGWWARVAGQLLGAHMIGQRWHISLRSGQTAGIKAQPWYRGRPILSNPKTRKVPFLCGGWWAARTHILTDHDYPFPQLVHNNGDVLLGILCDQQDYATTTFDEDVAINADAAGNHAKSKRRGATSRWPWEHYGTAKAIDDLAHQNFEVTIEDSLS